MRRLFPILGLVLAGCAGWAVQPPTPARYLDVRGLQEPRPCDRFYVLIFSSEKPSKQPRFTHTWATAVRVTDMGPGKAPPIEHHTISWMPATLDIYPLRTRVERGANLGLHDTFAKVALANDEQIALWGPYECRPSFYTRFAVQQQFLESGKIGYQCFDTVGEAAREGNGCNCIHAITDMDPEHGRRQYPLTRYGFAAGTEIARRLREVNATIDPARTHDFLIPILNLQSYPISRAGAEEILQPSRTPLLGNR